MPRPKVPLISRQGAVDAALRVVEEEGLESLTLERLARDLGVRAPSLYHHFVDKSDILEAAAYALLVDIPGPPVPSPQDWTLWFEEMCIRTYRHVLERPRAAKLLVEHFPQTLIFPAHDRASGLLISAGLPVDTVALVLRGLEKLTFGLILADAAEIMSGRAESADASADEWPAYRAALNANRRTNIEMFEETVKVFLAGVSTRYLSSSLATGTVRGSRRS